MQWCFFVFFLTIAVAESFCATQVENNIIKLEDDIKITCAAHAASDFLKLNGLNVDMLTTASIQKMDENDLVSFQELQDSLLIFGVKTKGVKFVRVNKTNFDEIPFPCITLIEDEGRSENHFVVLLGVEESNVIFIDNSEEKRIGRTQFIENWSRYALILDEASGEQDEARKLNLKDIFDPIAFQFDKIPSKSYGKAAYIFQNKNDCHLNITQVVIDERYKKGISIKTSRNSFEPGAIGSYCIFYGFDNNNSHSNIVHSVTFAIECATPEKRTVPFELTWTTLPIDYFEPDYTFEKDIRLHEKKRTSIKYYVSKEYRLEELQLTPTKKYPVNVSFNENCEFVEDMKVYTLDIELGPFDASRPIRSFLYPLLSPSPHSNIYYEIAVQPSIEFACRPSIFRVKQNQFNQHLSIDIENVHAEPFDIALAENPFPKSIDIDLIKNEDAHWKVDLKLHDKIASEASPLSPTQIVLKTTSSKEQYIHIPIIVVD